MYKRQDQPGITDHGDHAVDCHQPRNKPWQQIQPPDHPAGPAVGKPQINSQEIRDPDGQDHCYDHDLERIQDILPLDRVGKEVNIIVQAPAALLQLEAAEEAGRNGIEYDSRQDDQGRCV